MRQSPTAKGRHGEEMAVEYLINNGYMIVERNYKNCFGEIDVIASEGDTVVFVEVRARNTVYYGTPAASVDLRKQQRLYKVAAGYIVKKELSGTPVRFDVVSICEEKIEIIRDAFEIQEDFLW